MTALLILRRGGDVVGRCDAACYDAEHEDCVCVCLGRNHRAGFEKAVANTRSYAQEWVAEARVAGRFIDGYEPGLPVIQPALF